MGDDRSPTNHHCEASSTSPAPVDILSGEAVADAFKVLLTNLSMTDFSSSVSRTIEAHRERILCLILRCPRTLYNDDEAPPQNLPESHRAAGERLCIGFSPDRAHSRFSFGSLPCSFK
jgi:hypothetical protein